MIYDRKQMTVVFAGPSADKRVAALRVPAGHTWTIEDVNVVSDTTVGASTADYVSASVENGGTAGTGTTAISTAAGGTPGWVANTPKNVPITSGLGDLSEGQYLNVFHDITGTPTLGRFSVIIDYVDGIGAKA